MERVKHALAEFIQQRPLLKKVCGRSDQIQALLRPEDSGFGRVDADHSDLLEIVQRGEAFTGHPNLQFDYSAQIAQEFQTRQGAANNDVLKALSEYHGLNMDKINTVYCDIKANIDLHFKAKVQQMSGNARIGGEFVDEKLAESLNRVTNEH